MYALIYCFERVICVYNTGLHKGKFSRFDRNFRDGSSLQLTGFTVLAAEAVVRVLLVFHAAHLSCCAVLEVSCKPKLCRSMTHMNQSNDNRDLENGGKTKLDISICIHDDLQLTYPSGYLERFWFYFVKSVKQKL